MTSISVHLGALRQHLVGLRRTQRGAGRVREARLARIAPVPILNEADMLEYRPREHVGQESPLVESARWAGALRRRSEGAAPTPRLA